jgi:hypothetical protein
MPDRVRLLAATLLIALSVSMVGPALAFAVQLPGENCPNVLPGSSSAVACQPGGSGGGLNLGGLLPILGVALGGAAIVLGAAYVVIRRRTSGPAAPLDPREWWTCATCGKNNVVDSPRCYACGSWRT